MEERLRRAERLEGGSREVSTEALLLRSRTGDRYRIVAHESGLLVYNLSTGGDPLRVPVDAPAPVLVAGDSIAAGVPYNGGVPWSARLTLPGVVNVALGGQGWFAKPTYFIPRPEFVETVLASLPAETVIISGGTNDVGQLVSEGKTAHQVRDLLAEKITSDIETMHEHGLRVYLTTIWPVGSPDTFDGFLTDDSLLPAFREAIQATNEWLREDQGHRLFDLDPVVSTDEGWMRPEYDWIDHVHPLPAADLPVASLVDRELGFLG